MAKRADVWCITGETKSGKSSFAASFPAALILSLSARETNSKPAADAVVREIKSVSELRDIIMDLAAQGSELKYKNIVFDNGDYLYGLVEKDVCTELRISQVGLAAGGIDYGMARERFVGIITAFAATKGIENVIVVLSASKGRPDAFGRVTHSIGLPGRTSQVFLDCVAHLGYAYKTPREGNDLPEYFLSFRGGFDYEAGSDDTEVNNSIFSLSGFAKQTKGGLQ